MRLTAGSVLLTAAGAAALAQNAPLPTYTPSAQVTGLVRFWGSPQMGDLLTLYEVGFRQVQPGVTFENDLKSTITAVAGVYTGRADIGLLGREMWPTEALAFQSITGHKAAVIDVATGAYDVPKATFALMVFVPRANPLSSLTLEQLEQTFSAAGTGPAHTWGELGLTGAWAHRPIHLYGFTVDNDKSQIFAQLVFRHGERWNPAMHEFANADGGRGTDAGQQIADAVARDPDAIGISNVHYAGAAIKPLALAPFDTQTSVLPSKEAVANRSYPLTRAVYMVIDPASASPAAVEFLRYVLSAQGALAVTREGNYLPLTPAVAERTRTELAKATQPR